VRSMSAGRRTVHARLGEYPSLLGRTDPLAPGGVLDAYADFRRSLRPAESGDQPEAVIPASAEARGAVGFTMQQAMQRWSAHVAGAGSGSAGTARQIPGDSHGLTPTQSAGTSSGTSAASAVRDSDAGAALSQPRPPSALPPHAFACPAPRDLRVAALYQETLEMAAQVKAQRPASAYGAAAATATPRATHSLARHTSAGTSASLDASCAAAGPPDGALRTASHPHGPSLWLTSRPTTAGTYASVSLTPRRPPSAAAATTTASNTSRPGTAGSSAAPGSGRRSGRALSASTRPSTARGDTGLQLLLSFLPAGS
jgi:hypothetical protein